MTKQKKPSNPSKVPGGSSSVTTISANCPIKVFFSKSSKNVYGYDDYDTTSTTDPKQAADDHVSVEKQQSTYIYVKIDASCATSSDIDFKTDDPKVATVVAPSAGKTNFDLEIKGGIKNKAETSLKAVEKATGKTLATMFVNVYKKKVVNVIIGKFYDSKSKATSLNYPNADYAAAEPQLNVGLKEAVLEFKMENYNSNKATDIKFDKDKNGSLSFDIVNGGGQEFNELKTKFQTVPGKQRVMIINSLKSYYYLAKEAKAGDVKIKINAAKNFFDSGYSIVVGLGKKAEKTLVKSVSADEIELHTKLSNTHSVGTGVEFPAGGWSTDPIIIQEGTISQSEIERTITHEVGHRPVSLSDVVDSKNFMHFQQPLGNTLRHMPRTLQYSAGTENQWEKIPR